ncbi:MAG: LppA family lipoprotein [Mycolicibacterium neoaurum]|uniref:LppA family lipoprotein n=1 Tax=Mycolicibacterium neoaurum TaxID=1795 RepID=UPI002FFC5719
MKTAVAVVVLSTVALAACGTASGDNGGTAMTSTESGDPQATLRARPSFEDAQRQYRAAVQDWAAQIASMSPGLSWRAITACEDVQTAIAEVELSYIDGRRPTC